MMRRQTRRLLLNVATGVAVAATAAVMLLPSAASAAQLGFGINVPGPGGANFSLRFGTPVRGPGVRLRGQVCFYSNTRFRGDGFCLAEGQSVRDLGDDWTDEISSFDNPDGLDVTVCTRTRLRDCRTYTTSARSLGGLDDSIESIRVQ